MYVSVFMLLLFSFCFAFIGNAICRINSMSFASTHVQCNCDLYTRKIQRKASWLICWLVVVALCSLQFIRFLYFIYLFLAVVADVLSVCVFSLSLFLWFCTHCHCQSTIIIQSDRNVYNLFNDVIPASFNIQRFALDLKCTNFQLIRMCARMVSTWQT